MDPGPEALGQERPSPVLLALGYDAATAASGLRLSLGPWLCAADLQTFPAALAAAIADPAVPVLA